VAYVLTTRAAAQMFRAEITTTADDTVQIKWPYVASGHSAAHDGHHYRCPNPRAARATELQSVIENTSPGRGLAAES